MLLSSKKMLLIFVINFYEKAEYLCQNIFVKNYIQYLFLPLIVISLLMYQFRLTYYVIEYSIDNKSFTEKYCINKDKPSLQCNGKCHLTKIAKENSENNTPTTHFLEKEIVLNQINQYENCFFPISENRKLIFSFEKNVNSGFQFTDYPPPKSYFL